MFRINLKLFLKKIHTQMENAMNIIENLSEELGEKEEHIMKLEKQLEIYKSLTGEMDMIIHNIVLYEILNDIKNYQDEYTDLEVGEISKTVLYMDEDVCNHILPESLSSVDYKNFLDTCTKKYELSNEDDTLIIKRIS